MKGDNYLENYSISNNRKSSLEPWVGDNPKVLILETMAGDSSISAQAYYNDPGNPFWKLMADVFQASPGETADSHKAFITSRGIALWDCIKDGERYLSSDKNFVRKTLARNDISGFLTKYPTINTIILNGTSTTVKFFNRYCVISSTAQVIALPSMASMTNYKREVEVWKVLSFLT